MYLKTYNIWHARRYFRDGYLRAMAELIEKELLKFDAPADTEIFFSAHGVPVSYVEQVILFWHPFRLTSPPRFLRLSSTEVAGMQPLVLRNVVQHLGAVEDSNATVIMHTRRAWQCCEDLRGGRFPDVCVITQLSLAIHHDVL